MPEKEVFENTDDFLHAFGGALFRLE